MAARNGDFEIVEYLVENGAKIQSKTTKGETPRDLAEANNRNDHFDHFELLELASRKKRFSKTIQFLKDKEAQK